MPARLSSLRLGALAAAASALIVAVPRAADDPVPGGTRLLRTPTVSATHIAFAYANNIWIVERAGGDARRLTSFQGQTSNPQVLARRHDDRVQRRLRRQHRRLRRAGRAAASRSG